MTRAEVEALRDSMPARRDPMTRAPAWLVWSAIVVCLAALWTGVVALAWAFLPMPVAQGGVGLLAILACGLLVAVTR